MKTFKSTGGENNYITRTNDLYKRISQISKEINYLDLYNIIDVVTDKTTVRAQINNLTPNSSLVINTEPFYVNSDFYNTGDIILKNSTGRVIHIPAQPGGIYFPASIKSNSGTYQIEYQYYGQEPQESPISVPADTDSIRTPSKKITFTNLEAQDPGNSYIYGIWSRMNDWASPTLMYQFQCYKHNEQLIQPQIQFWLVDEQDTPKEQIFTDYTTSTISDEKWVIQISKPEVCLEQILKQIQKYQNSEDLKEMLDEEDNLQNTLNIVSSFNINSESSISEWSEGITQHWGEIDTADRNNLYLYLQCVPNVFIKVK